MNNNLSFPLENKSIKSFCYSKDAHSFRCITIINDMHGSHPHKVHTPKSSLSFSNVSDNRRDKKEFRAVSIRVNSEVLCLCLVQWLHNFTFKLRVCMLELSEATQKQVYVLYEVK